MDDIRFDFLKDEIITHDVHDAIPLDVFTAASIGNCKSLILAINW